MAEKRISSFFLTRFQIFVRPTKVVITRPILKFFVHFFYMGLHYVDFTFIFDTTLIRLEMTEIWPKKVAQAVLPPLNRRLRNPPG